MLLVDIHGVCQTMNSLNILSARVIGQSPLPSPDKSLRSRSRSESSRARESTGITPRRTASEHEKSGTAVEAEKSAAQPIPEIKLEESDGTEITNEKAPLLGDPDAQPRSETKQGKIRLAAQRLVAALAESLRWVLAKLAAPGIYVVTCFYTEQGHFSPLLPLRKMRRKYPAHGSSSTAHAVGLSGSANLSDTESEKEVTRSKPSAASIRKIKAEEDALSVSTTDSERDTGEDGIIKVVKAKSTNASGSGDESTPQRRSIRIKLKNEDSVRAKKKKIQANNENDSEIPLAAATLKSPTSPAASLRLTKYPRAPAPPRPLIPRRQPSYTTTPGTRSQHLTQKTLVIDLDETLIHSLAKGGRMSSGHMVEVKLQTTVSYGSGGTTIGPQHPILYYVHKRPHCDDFLRKVCKWYNLVVFTASVQEYADPVIDWLEQERKYFSKRFYRQHCTFRNGAYIKDLSSVEPDLSRVMILDNSPLSYIFHEGMYVSEW